jgi:4,5-DOPA dioxygenase extradiol
MERRHFLKTLALVPLAPIAMKLQDLYATASTFPKTAPLPVLFAGHGSPMNALEDNAFTRAMQQLGLELRARYQPKAIVVVSAHWLTRGTFVTTNERPATIHDFGGFPEALERMQYPAPGSPELARQITEMVPDLHGTDDWGLDHGTWTLLHHLFPQADIPVLQVSIDYAKSLAWHFDFAKQLRFLRERGVLVMGSGNIVHNLRASMPRFMNQDARPFDWAIEFDQWVGDKLTSGDYRALIDYQQAGASGPLAVPTLDHYLPMLYTLGLAGKDEPLRQLYEEVSFGGMSMRTFAVG